MARTVEMTLPAEKTDYILPKIKKFPGVISLRIQKNSAILPKGDVITFEVTNNKVSSLLKMLEKEKLLDNNDTYITTTQPVSVIYQPASDKIMSEGSESSWEEILNSINHESTMTVNGLIIMFVSGIAAVYGISTNSLHIVIGAMLIAPGFEPITRISLGLAASHKDWTSGVKDTVKGYVLLFIGAIIAAFSIKFLNVDLIPGSSTYLEKGELISYWTKISLSSIIVSSVASIGGAVILITNKSVLTSGVMIALALVPTAAIAGMGIVEGDWSLTIVALKRFLFEVAIVGIFAWLVFLWKRFTSMNRKMRA